MRVEMDSGKQNWITTSKADKITFAFSFSSNNSEEFRNLSAERWIRSSDVTSYTVYKNT